MTRDEVLARLDKSLAIDDTWACIVSRDTLRAAAELIRAGGWRPIAECGDNQEALRCGAWEYLPDGSWRWYSPDQKMTGRYARGRGFTHYLPMPEPPARKDSKAKNGEENDRQT